MSLVDKFRNSLSRTRGGFVEKIDHLISTGEMDDCFYEELEEILVSGDVGIGTSLKLVEKLRTEAVNQRIRKREDFRVLLVNTISEMLTAETTNLSISTNPYLILLVGVNGSGKTTTAAKLAGIYCKEGRKVLLVAGDTFRAAAVEQLEVWSKRAGADLIKQHSGSDPSALYFDAINAAKSRKTEIIIGDTAGRLHNKYNLMEELKKIYRVIGRNLPGAPHQVMLVIDATTGQNALVQAKTFNEALPLSGVILTKIDGTARGGIILAIRDSLKIPVLYLGTGEKMEDLTPFEAVAFTQALLQ
jgi:fused signal recognition particle receptor